MNTLHNFSPLQDTEDLKRPQSVQPIVLNTLNVENKFKESLALFYLFHLSNPFINKQD